MDEPDAITPARPADIFVTTRWTVVLAAAQREAPQADAALEELCRTYWYPLYVFVRSRGETRHDAEDLTQSFFARLLEKNYIVGLGSDKGRFRAFLLAALKHFLANEWDRTHRQKRGGGVALLPLNWEDADSRYEIQLADRLSPDRLYDRAWAVTLLERVIARLKAEAEAEGTAGLFERAKPFLTAGKGVIPYAGVANALGITEGALRTAVHRVRRRYRELLRDEIAQTLADPANADEELQALFHAFSDAA